MRDTYEAIGDLEYAMGEVENDGRGLSSLLNEMRVIALTYSPVECDDLEDAMWSAFDLVRSLSDDETMIRYARNYYRCLVRGYA